MKYNLHILNVLLALVEGLAICLNMVGFCHVIGSSNF